MLKVLIFTLLQTAWVANQAWALKVTPEQVDCLGWFHDRSADDFAVTHLTQSEIDPMMFEGEISGIQFGADFAYLSQEGVGLFLFDPLTGTHMFSISGWYKLGSSNTYEANLTVQSPDPQRKSVQFGIRCLTDH